MGLRGNLAPQGAIVKVAGMKNLRFVGKALCFGEGLRGSVPELSELAPGSQHFGGDRLDGAGAATCAGSGGFGRRSMR